MDIVTQSEDMKMRMMPLWRPSQLAKSDNNELGDAEIHFSSIRVTNVSFLVLSGKEERPSRNWYETLVTPTWG